MSFPKVCAAVFVTCCLFASSASAQTNTWTAGFPKSPAAGQVTVDGTATAQAGWTLTGSGLVTYWKDGGGIILTVPITVDPMTGKWNKTFTSSLGAGVKIVIVVQAQIKNNTNPNMRYNIGT